MEKDAVEARIAYLECIKKLCAEKKDATAFEEALRNAYPDMQGDIAPMAEALYK